MRPWPFLVFDRTSEKNQVRKLKYKYQKTQPARLPAVTTLVVKEGGQEITNNFQLYDDICPYLFFFWLYLY